MLRLSLIGAVVLILFPAMPAFAQHGHGHDHPSSGPVVTPPVTYTMGVNVIPETATVHTRLELTYRNEGPDTVRSLCLFSSFPFEYRYRPPRRFATPDSTGRDSLPLPVAAGTVVIDSILYRGVPLLDEELSIHGSRLIVHLPVPVLPGGIGFLMMTLTTFMPDDFPVWYYQGWFPRVCAPADSTAEPAAEFAHFNVTLEIDSAWSLAYPGELVNNKEHYGLVPTPAGDTVLVDIVNRHQLEYGGRIYMPEFEGGVKRFIIWGRNVKNFAFVCREDFLRDRTNVDSLMIEVCYSPAEISTWADSVARWSSEIVRRYEPQRGHFPYKYLTIAVGRDSLVRHDAKQLIVIPSEICDTEALRTVLEERLAACWR